MAPHPDDDAALEALERQASKLVTAAAEGQAARSCAERLRALSAGGLQRWPLGPGLRERACGVTAPTAGGRQRLRPQPFRGKENEGGLAPPERTQGGDDDDGDDDDDAGEAQLQAALAAVAHRTGALRARCAHHAERRASLGADLAEARRRLEEGGARLAELRAGGALLAEEDPGAALGRDDLRRRLAELDQIGDALAELELQVAAEGQSQAS